LSLYLRGCEKTETIQKPKECPPAYVAPVDGDGKCETAKGENDPMLPVFSAKDCGICGDGIQNNDGTHTGTEYANLCPADFHCVNGKVDQNEPYAAMIEDKENPGSYVWRVVFITESCVKGDANYCPEPSCPKEEPKKVSGHRRTPKEPEEPSGNCVVKKCDGVKPGQIGARILRAVNEGDLRQKCSGDIRLSGEFRVTPSGVPTQKGTISATCDGSDMGISGKKADLTGVTVGAPGGECDCSLKVSPPVSKAGNSG